MANNGNITIRINIPLKMWEEISEISYEEDFRVEQILIMLLQDGIESYKDSLC